MTVQLGDIILHKRSGLLSAVLSLILQWWVSSQGYLWDRWPWHVGFVSKIEDGQIYETAEIGTGLACDIPLTGQYRIYRVPNLAVTREQIEQFQAYRKGAKYADNQYFLTLIERIFNLNFRIMTRSFTCWTLTLGDFLIDCRVWIEPEWGYPLITDLLMYPGLKLIYSSEST